MSCFSEAVSTRFKAVIGEDVISSLEAAYAELIKRRREWVNYGDLRTITEPARANANCEVLGQALLHRAEKMIVSSGTMIGENNIYGLALMVRGHLEATAMLGYFCERLRSFAAGNVPFDDIAWNIAGAALGAKHEQFAAAPQPINTMTCIEKADRYLEANGFPAGKRMIADCYAWLSDFAHPNFLSMGSAIEAQDNTGRMRILHDVELGPRELSTLGYLDISAKLFLKLFDDFADRAADAFPAP
jgi:hypothetical protein